MNGHTLWSAAFFLMTLLAVMIGYYDLIFAVIFWTIATLILITLRPE